MLNCIRIKSDYFSHDYATVFATTYFRWKTKIWILDYKVISGNSPNYTELLKGAYIPSLSSQSDCDQCQADKLLEV